MRRTLLWAASLAAVIAAVGFAPTSPASASPARMLSSDATAHFMVRGRDRSVVTKTPTDIKDVLIASPDTIKVVVLSRRRVSIIGKRPGETNLYFLDADGRQLDALDIAVTTSEQEAGGAPGAFELDPRPADKVVVFRGLTSLLYTRTPSTCIYTPSTTKFVCPPGVECVIHGK